MALEIKERVGEVSKSRIPWWWSVVLNTVGLAAPWAVYGATDRALNEFADIDLPGGFSYPFSEEGGPFITASFMGEWFAGALEISIAALVIMSLVSNKPKINE